MNPGNSNTSKVIEKLLLLIPMSFILGFYYVLSWKIYYPRALSYKWLIIVVSSFLTAMEVWCFVAVVLKDPGKAPPYWGFYMGDSDTKKKRYCLICHLFKPERSHHCSVCNRCVLNMDHHCPWVNNCIGFFNRKFFILLLLYSLANIFFTLVFVAPISIESIYFLLSVDNPPLTPHALYFAMLVFLVLISIVLTSFTRFHLRLVIENSTTIEELEKREVNVYTMGSRLNWIQVFGGNPWLWPFPVFGNSGKPIGDGVEWKQTHKEEEQRQGYDSEIVKEAALKVDLSQAPSPFERNRREVSDNETDTSFLRNR